MKRFFRKMDMLKWVMVCSAAAATGLGIWNLVLRKHYEEALRTFERAKGDIVKIHSELEQIRTFLIAKRDSERSGELLDPGVFFANQIAKKAGIDINDFKVNPEKEREVSIRRGRSRKRAIDREVEIGFKVGRKIKPIPRENLFVALFNCEAASHRWKLRELRIRAKEAVSRSHKRGTAYPAELSDEWVVEKMVFVSREPKK